MISQIAHLPFYLEDSRVRVVAVAESRPSLIANLHNALHVEQVFVDHRDILNDETISTVVIVAPRQCTGPLVLEALCAGKNVITEKPMAFTAAQAQRHVAVAQDKGLAYLVGFMKRYDAGIQAAQRVVRDLLASDRFGRLLYARFYDFAKSYAHQPQPHKRPEESRTTRFETWPTAPDWLDEGYHRMYGWFVNAASHDVNLMRYFFGDALSLMYADAPNENALSAYYRYNDAPVTFECAASETGVWEQGAEFVFEKGRVALSIPSPMDVKSVSAVVIDDNSNGKAASYEREILDIPAEWCFKSQARAFIDHLTLGKEILTSGRDCVHDLVMTEHIWRKIIER